MTAPATFSSPPGLVAVTTHGLTQSATVQFLWEARSFNEERGLRNIKYAMIPGSLVDKARCDALRMMLRENLQWTLFIDADMVAGPDAMFLMLQTAYSTHQHFDVLGAMCHLRGDLAIPTIDTGTGTWESHYPGNGVIEVMRTGGAFLLVKRHVCERMPDPWFSTRTSLRPLDALAEVDNFARIKFDGTNPLRNTPEWAVLESIASQEPSAVNWTPAEVGEDSGFCDKVKLYGMRIGVNTDIVTGHLHQEVVDWKQHKKAMAQRELEQRWISGCLV